MLQDTLNKNTLKTVIKLPAWRNTTHNFSVMGIIFAGTYHGYNYSYLMLTNYIRSRYISDRFCCRNVTDIELYMGSVMGVVYVLLLRV